MTNQKSVDLEFPSDVEDITGISGFSEQLPGDPRRQAVSSIHGIVYQAWWSIDAWLKLKDANEVIYLEGAEDFDRSKPDSATAVQVKRNIGSISLGTAKAHVALENFWALSCKEGTRQIDYHYLTTSSVAMEQDANFGSLKGIEAWRAAMTNTELVTVIKEYLVNKLDSSSPLRAFLISATGEFTLDRLIKRFHWLTDQPDTVVVKRSVKDRIAVLLKDQRRNLGLIPEVLRCLESRFWEVVVEPSAAIVPRK